MIPFSFRQLEYLIACVQEGSVAAAAQRLHVSQPSISAAIAKLEVSLGVQLLLRQHGQGVRATATAERLLPDMRRMLADADALERTAKGAASEVAGELRLGSFSPLAPTYLPGMIAALQAVHPGIRIRLEEGTQADLVDGLREGRHEQALLYDLDLPHGLRLTRLADLRPHVLLNASHRLADRSVIDLADLHDLPFILLDVPPSRAYFTKILREAGLDMPVAHASPSLEVVRGLVGQGLGFSILVTRPKGDQSYAGARLSVLPISNPVATSPVVLASRVDLQPTRVMSAFEDLAKSHFEKLAR